MTCDTILILGFLTGILGGVLFSALDDTIQRVKREKSPARFDPPV
jgi:hypothetical protein